MKECLMRLKPEEMEISFNRINKQNRKGLHGCILQLPGAAASPTFYFEDLYEAYLNGTAPEDIAESLINFARENNLDSIPGNIDIDDYDCVRKNLGLMVIGEEKNREYLEDMIYKKIEDLALIPIIFTNDKYGTGCITDVGMTGTINSVLGVMPELAIKKFRDRLPVRFDLASGACRMDCILFDIDEKTGSTVSVKRMEIRSSMLNCLDIFENIFLINFLI